MQRVAIHGFSSIRLRMKVFSPMLLRRLRILKTLSSGSYTLQELADEFGVAKTTIHHHLIQLRSAGLVRMRMSDKRFSLRRYAIDNLGELLNRYLNGPSQ